MYVICHICNYAIYVYVIFWCVQILILSIKNQLTKQHNNFWIFFSHIITEGLISYSIPKGVTRGIEIDLSDQTYDGKEDGYRLVGGLGQLVDGHKGTDNFRTDIYGFGKGKFIFN